VLLQNAADVAAASRSSLRKSCDKHATCQTTQHASDIDTAPALRRINALHINADKLEAAMVDVINQYARFPLQRHWGSGRTAIADGTHVKHTKTT
jgi:TnpA family transposase